MRVFFVNVYVDKMWGEQMVSANRNPSREEADRAARIFIGACPGVRRVGRIKVTLKLGWN